MSEVKTIAQLLFMQSQNLLSKDAYDVIYHLVIPSFWK